MKLVFAAVFAVASIVGSTPGFAARGFTHGFAHASQPRISAFHNRIPAPLGPPPQAPVINGPLNPTGLPTMGGGRQP
jgi:hypothetical protein